jgi:phage terminase small subunit
MQEPLKNPRHEEFARGVANGLTISEAYRRAGFSVKGAGQGGERLLKNVEVSSRVEELRQEHAKKSNLTEEKFVKVLSECFLGKREMRADQLKAGEMIAKTCKWNGEEKISVAVDGLQELLNHIRSGAKA